MSQIVTSCQDCQSAVYDKDQKNQVGCEFDLLEKYKDAGIEILEAFDGDKNFNVIKRICMYSRHKLNPQSQQDVLEAIKVKYHVIIVLSNTNIDDFSLCLDSVLCQDIKPQSITVARKNEVDILPFKITKLLARSGIKWKYQDCVDPNFTENDLIDASIDGVSVPFYVVIRNNKKLPKEFSLTLNEMVNVKFVKFSVIRGDDIDVVATIFHKQLGGNSFKPLWTKILEDKELRDTLILTNLGPYICSK